MTEINAAGPVFRKHAVIRPVGRDHSLGDTQMGIGSRNRIIEGSREQTHA